MKKHSKTHLEYGYGGRWSEKGVLEGRTDVFLVNRNVKGVSALVVEHLGHEAQK